MTRRLVFFVLSLILSIVLVAQESRTTVAAPLERVKLGEVPRDNGTATCREAREHLIDLNRLAEGANRLIGTDLDPARREQLERQITVLKKNLSEAGASAKRACEAQLEGVGQQGQGQPQGQRPQGQRTAKTAPLPPDNGTTPCRQARQRISYLNGELEKAVANLNFPNPDPKIEQVRRQELELRISRLEKELHNQAVPLAKRACARN